MGKVISIAAYFLLRDAWLSLHGQLQFLRARYLILLKPEMPAVLANTLIAAEDHRFDRHFGIDPIAVARAFWWLIFRGKLIGGSTIEQQLVRTLTGRYERKIRRKVKEMLFATLVHRAVPKADIPGLYLSVAYFGWRMNGIKQACSRLGFNLASLTPSQAASLVARLKYPEPRDLSLQRFQQIINRTQYVLRVMAKRGPRLTLTEVEAGNAEAVLDF